MTRYRSLMLTYLMTSNKQTNNKQTNIQTHKTPQNTHKVYTQTKNKQTNEIDLNKGQGQNQTEFEHLTSLSEQEQDCHKNI